MTTTAEAQTHTTWVTSALAPVDHAVTGDAMTAGLATRGAFVALCGVRFLSAPMTVAPGPVCASCRLFIQARVSLPSMEHRLCGRRHRRHGLPGAFARLLAVLLVSDSPVALGPRSATAADVASPARAAGSGSRRGRVDGGHCGARSRRVPPVSALAGG